MTSPETKHYYSSQNGTKSWENKLSRVVMYDPSSHGLTMGDLTKEDRNFHFSLRLPKLANFLEQSSLAVQLPRWRNRVDIYTDEKARSGFVATVKLDRLGSKTNWQRRLRHKYTTLYVKGSKPET